VQFRITPHSTYAPPADALDLLWQRLSPKYEDVSFARVGAEIRATTNEDAPVSMTRDERAEIGRRAVLAVLRDVCEGAPELSSDWYAVGAGS
jgi:hypothetical protein